MDLAKLRTVESDGVVSDKLTELAYPQISARLNYGVLYNELLANNATRPGTGYDVFILARLTDPEGGTVNEVFWDNYFGREENHWQNVFSAAPQTPNAGLSVWAISRYNDIHGAVAAHQLSGQYVGTRSTFAAFDPLGIQEHPPITKVKASAAITAKFQLTDEKKLECSINDAEFGGNFLVRRLDYNDFLLINKDNPSVTYPARIVLSQRATADNFLVPTLTFTYFDKSADLQRVSWLQRQPE